MDPAATAQAVGQQPGGLYDMPVGMAYGDPSMQPGPDGRISYDAGDAQMMQMYQHQFAQHSMPSALLGRKHAPDRRPLRFWQPFNDWWRSELTRLGRRPTSEEIGEWYIEAADRTWGEIKPTLQETRVHAKCLRSLPLVRDYFRNYRAKKKAKGSDGSGYDGEDTGDGDTEDGTDNGGSSRRQRPPGNKRARLGMTPSNSNPEAGAPTTSSQGRAAAGGNNSDPGVAAEAAGNLGAGGYGGLDLLQAYQTQYWEPAQSEDFARQAMLRQMQQVALYQQLAAAQQLSSGVQFTLLQQQQAQDAADPAKLAAAAAAAAAAAVAKVAAVPEDGGDPVSGAAGDDEHIDHEPLPSSGVALHRPRQPAQADTATSNAAPQAAGAHAAAAAVAEAAGSHHTQGLSGSMSHGRASQHGSAHEAGAADAPAVGATSHLPAGAAQQQMDMAAGNAGQEQRREGSGSEQQGQGVPEQEAEPMDADWPAEVGAEGVQQGSPEPASAAAEARAAEAGMHLGGSHTPGCEQAQQQQVQDTQQPGQQPQQQQQPSSGSRLRQQPVELDLRDPAAQAGTSSAGAGAISAGAGVISTAGADAAAGRFLQRPQQPQQQLRVAVGIKAAGAADLQAALLSAATGAAAAGLGPTAMSPYVQGTSAAAAAVAAAAGGLNLADSPQIRAAVEQEEPHPGAQLPEAAAAALAATPAAAAAGHLPGGATEHRARTPGAEAAAGRGISVDVDEAELLNDVEMGGMSHGELVAHIRKVQQELLAKRELLGRSFDQLRRVQDKLARRERKLAKEQQKCKQYQNAVATWQAAWQAAALPSLEPSAQDPAAADGQVAPAAVEAAAAGPGQAEGAPAGVAAAPAAHAEQQ